MGGCSSRRRENSEETEDEEEKRKKLLEEAKRVQAEREEESKNWNEQKADIQKKIRKNLGEQEELTRKLDNEESPEARKELKRKGEELNELYKASDELENREKSPKLYKDLCQSIYDLGSTFKTHVRFMELQLRTTIQDIEDGGRLTDVPDLASLVDNELQDFGAVLQQFVPDGRHTELRHIGLKAVCELNRLLNEIISRIEHYQAEYDPKSDSNAARLRRYSIREHVAKVHKELDELNSALRELWRNS